MTYPMNTKIQLRLPFADAIDLREEAKRKNISLSKYLRQILTDRKRPQKTEHIETVLHQQTILLKQIVSSSNGSQDLLEKLLNGLAEMGDE